MADLENGQPIDGDVIPAVTAAWTSATALNTALSINTTGMGSVGLSINVAGTVTGGFISFYGSDDGGTTWYLLNLTAIFTASSATGGGLGTGVSNMFVGNISPMTAFQARLTLAIVGAGTVTVRVQASSLLADGSIDVQQATAANLNATVVQGAPNTAANAWPAKITDGTNVASVTAKGTQGTEALTVQEYKDSGRSYVTLTAVAVASVAAEALMSLVANTAGTAAAAATSYTVPAGKTLRIQAVSFTATGGGTSNASLFRVRAVPSGALAVTSPILLTGRATYNTASQSNPINSSVPDGLELPAGSVVGISHGGAAGNTEDVTLIGYLY